MARTAWSRRMTVGFFLGFAIASLYAFSEGGAVTDFGAKIPKTFGGWEASAKDRTFNRQTLYDYMDGGAEVYLAFDFREVFSRKYGGPGGRELTLDVYDMGSPEEAFGAFSCDREDPGVGIGQESEYGPGLLRFWQGRYFVTIMASSDDETAGAAVLELGREAAKTLGPPGRKPDLVAFLPTESLRADRTSYFHSVVNLNNRFFVSSENILRLDRSTECVFAEYGPEGAEPCCLLLIRYPDAGKAGSACQSFLASYLPGAGSEGAGQTENKKWTAASVRKNYLAIVFAASSREEAGRLAASVKFPEK